MFTSNVFAILGLRSLYFALAGMIHRFRYLKAALADICPSCRGVWLDRGELEKLIAHVVGDAPGRRSDDGDDDDDRRRQRYDDDDDRGHQRRRSWWDIFD